MGRQGPVRPREEPADHCGGQHRTAQYARDPKPGPTSLWHGCLPAKTGTSSFVLTPVPLIGTSSMILVGAPLRIAGPEEMQRCGSVARDGSGIEPSVRHPTSASTSTGRDLSGKPDSGKITLKIVEVFRALCRTARASRIA